MLWSRFGTEIPDSLNPDTGRPYGSGTEYEFYDAYRAYQRRGRPTLLLYRCTAPPPPTAQPEQIAKVINFFDRFGGAKPTLKGLYRTFSSPDELRSIVTDDVEALIANWDRPARQFRDRAASFLLPAVVIVVALVIAALALLTRSSVPPLENAPFNIAFAGFSADANANIPAADVEVLTQAFHNDLKIRIDEVQSELPLTVGLWSPQQLEPINGVDEEARAANAAALVERLKNQHNVRADIVIYGVLREQNGQVAVVPEFFIADTWPEISEVFGRFELAEALYAPNISQTRALSGELSARSQILTYIIQGITQLILHQYEEARRTFDLALRISGEGEGSELIYVLLGNTSLSAYNRITSGGTAQELRQRPTVLAEAEADFEEAIRVNRDYSRAYIGLGSVRYLTLFDTAGQNWDSIAPAAINDVETTYQQALEAHDRPESADITTKVALGLGQVELLRALQGNPQAADQARTYFGQVIDDYGDGQNVRVLELAAEANSRLGLLSAQDGNYEQARTYYNEAISLTMLEERRGVFQRRLLEIEIEEKQAKRDIAGAVAAYDQLLGLDMRPVERGILLFRKGKMQNENGDQNGALATYEAATELDLRDDPALAAQVWVELGDLYYSLDRLTDSIAAYEEALTLNPEGQAHLAQLITETQAELGTPEVDSER
jgi:tetratricopeptide (TPR) repeat protein